MRQQALELSKSLLANKFRSFLAMIGISIGTAAVVGLIYAGILATESSLKRISEMGTQIVSLTITNNQNSSGYSFDSLLEAKKRHNKIQNIIPIVRFERKFQIKSKEFNSYVLESTPEIELVLHTKIKNGRFLNIADPAASTCVLGYDLARAIKKGGILHPVGEKLIYGYGSCLIVGELDKLKSNFFLPFDANDALLTNIHHSSKNVKDIVINFKAGVDVSAQSDYVVADLKSMVPETRFLQRTPKFLIDHIKSEKTNMQWLLGVIGSISLLVGGIGIMNIMLVSVVERKQEIGLRLSVGATPEEILQMFLYEALLLCIIGGALGVILGLALSALVAMFSGWQFSWHFWPVILGFGVSTLVGLFFGYYPAKKAAYLDPIMCIRGL